MNTLVMQTTQMGHLAGYTIRAGKDFRAKTVWSGDSLIIAFYKFSLARLCGKYVYVVLESSND